MVFKPLAWLAGKITMSATMFVDVPVTVLRNSFNAQQGLELLADL